MVINTDYLAYLSNWVQINPNKALALAFIVSFAESLAIIGAIVPGVVTMTAIGMLAGAGLMPIDLTLLMVSLGAIAGDGISYLLGYTFSQSIKNFWFFKRNPTWLNYGTDFFNKHGSMSVFIGRFIGPIRSLIPVIAGMMQMKRMYFYTANITSGFLWSLLYLMPGIMISKVGHNLSPHQSSRLFVIILLSISGFWIISKIIAQCIYRFGYIYHSILLYILIKIRKKPAAYQLLSTISSYDDASPLPTLNLLIFALMAFVGLVLLIACINIPDLIYPLNLSSYLSVQSLQTIPLDWFFIFMDELLQIKIIILLHCVMLAIFIFYKNIKQIRYWLAINVTISLCLFLLKHIVRSLHPIFTAKIDAGFSFPDIGLTYITTIYLTIFAFSYTQKKSFTATRSSIGLGQMYLGNSWISDILGSYLLAIFIVIIFSIFYRKTHIIRNNTYSQLILIISGTQLLVAIALFYVNHQQHYQEYQLYFNQYIIDKAQWWKKHKQSILPLYRINRFGHPEQIFNVQYAGDIDDLEDLLLAHNWHENTDSSLQIIINKLLGEQTSQKTPVLNQLYLNRRPISILTRHMQHNNAVISLKFWHSNFYLDTLDTPIWVGNMHCINFHAKNSNCSMQLFSTITNYLQAEQYKIVTIKGHNQQHYSALMIDMSDR